MRRYVVFHAAHERGHQGEQVFKEKRLGYECHTIFNANIQNLAKA